MAHTTTAPAAWAGEIEAWAASLRAAGAREQTVGLRTYHLRRLGRDLGGSPWDVTAEQLVTWAGEQTWARETRRSWRSSMRAFWAWGMATGRATHDAAAGLGRVRPQEPRPRPTPEDVLREALATAEPRVRLMIRLGAEAGLRRGEVARVHRDDLVEDLAGWSLRVHGKGGRVRWVPLTASLALAVRTACVTNGWAFPGQDGGHLSAVWVGRLVSRALPEGWAMHSLRHRFASAAWRVDTDLVTVQELLGHASPETTRRYVQHDDGRLRATVVAVSRAA